MSQDSSLTVNTTTLLSISIKNLNIKDEELKAKYPELCAIYAYGKGDKQYYMGYYLNKSDAQCALRWFHDAMDNKDKTYKFPYLQPQEEWDD